VTLGGLGGSLENHDRSRKKIAVMMCLQNMGTACCRHLELFCPGVVLPSSQFLIAVRSKLNSLAASE
jgi:hypothetical protein